MLYTEMQYDLELERVVQEIKRSKATIVCIQLPDGLKAKAKDIVDALEQATHAEILIWAGSNFGACDLALDAAKLGADLLIHFGHKEWGY